MRKFEVVKDFAIKYGVKDVQLPTRGTKYAAAYDFYSPIDVVIEPHGKEMIFSNVKADMEEDEFLMLAPRSSMGKMDISIACTVGIIDKDYYGNPNNDGNIGLFLKNNGDQPFVIKKGDRLVQGVFMKILLVENDIVVNQERKGGFGSTDNK